MGWREAFDRNYEAVTGRLSANAPGIIAVQPILGLSNRVRTISSFAVLARWTGRAFRLSWVPSRGFSEEGLSDLFENEFEQIDDTEFASLSASGLCLHEATSVKAADVFADTHADIAYRGYQTVPALVRRGSVTRIAPGFFDAFGAELATWRPAPAIGPVLDELTAEFDANTIGVHVRRGDAIVHPVSGWKFRMSTDDAFFARMDGLLARAPLTTFFLATDDAETEQRFRERYGDALRTNAAKRFVPSISRAPKENQRDAAIDLFALSRTRRIIGSQGSTFSSLASSIGGIPLERAIDNSVGGAGLRRRVGRMLRR